MNLPKRHPSAPEIDGHAWWGALGGAAMTIAPSTEADPVAVLVSILALFGAMVGDRPYVTVGGARHPARIWPLIVGKTGSGRKGTSWYEARRFAEYWGSYAEGYVGHRIVGGLSSGEGLIAALRGEDDDTSGVADGMLTILETEFARVLTSAKREGSTLGQVLLQLWDDGAAATLTKQAVRVSDTHPVVVAHVTPRELRLRLAESDLAGGTLNRFIPLFSERPHLLAHEPARVDLTKLGSIVGSRIMAAKSRTEVPRDPSTKAVWTAAYEALAAEEPDGPLGSVLARGPAYVMRIALIYALADGSTTITADHLLAGLAVWDYAIATAKELFSDTVSKTKAEKLVEFLRTAGDRGRTRTEITVRCFGGNTPADEITHMLRRLVIDDLVRATKDPAAKGRPAEHFMWIGQPILSPTEAARIARKNEVTNEAP